MSDRHPGSFRDPSGFVFRREGVLLRQVQAAYADEWAALRGSGLLEELVGEGLLVESPEADLALVAAPGAVAVLRPRELPFVSHPSEWSFGMLRDAARATLDIQRRALDRGFTLKDASAYNVLFDGGRPVFIDTLSFERRRDGEPWIAYAQFCRHFLAPLALMAHVDVRLGDLTAVHLDGIPLDLAARLLPARTRMNSGLAIHLHAHAAADARASQPNPSGRGGGDRPPPRMGEAALRGLIENLDRTIAGLGWEPRGTEWADYYADTNYTAAAAEAKTQAVGDWLRRRAGEGAATAWDLGANDGRYSRLAARAGLWTLAADVDPAAVEQAYRWVRREGESRLHPLRIDLRNPTPDFGWGGRERAGLFARGPADVVLALALVHHLAIGNQVPLPMVGDTLARLGRTAIVEWVPKDDSQVRRMMRARRDVFEDYTEAAFVAGLPAGWAVRERVALPESGRVLLEIGPR